LGLVGRDLIKTAAGVYNGIKLVVRVSVFNRRLNVEEAVNLDFGYAPILQPS